MAQAYQEGKPLPPVDYSKALGATLIHPLRAFTDASDCVYVVFVSADRRYVASFSRKDAGQLLGVLPLKPVVLRHDPTMPTRTLLALLARGAIPREWLKELEEES